MSNLYGILFRRESNGILADIEQMFYCFLLDADHRKYLKFIWRKDDSEKPLVDYQMKVNVFGNSPSPAVETYRLRKTADEAEAKYVDDVKKFVQFYFYQCVISTCNHRRSSIFTSTYKECSRRIWLFTPSQDNL